MMCVLNTLYFVGIPNKLLLSFLLLEKSHPYPVVDFRRVEVKIVRLSKNVHCRLRN